MAKQILNTDEIKPCSSCGGPIVPIHYKIKIEQVGIDMGSVQEFVGLTQFFHGNSRLADVMGTGIKAQVLNTYEGVLCLSCQEPILHLMGILGEQEEA